MRTLIALVSKLTQQQTHLQSSFSGLAVDCKLSCRCLMHLNYFPQNYKLIRTYSEGYILISSILPR